jgi:hypothetical protein
LLAHDDHAQVKAVSPARAGDWENVSLAGAVSLRSIPQKGSPPSVMAIFQNTVWQLDNECNPTLEAGLQFGAADDFVYNLTDLRTSEEVRWEGRWVLHESESAGAIDEGNGQRISLAVDRLFVKPPGAKAFDSRYPTVLSEVKSTGETHLGDIEKREMWLKLKPLMDKKEVAESETKEGGGDLLSLSSGKGKNHSTESEDSGAFALRTGNSDTPQKTLGGQSMCSCEVARDQFWCVHCHVLHCDHCKCVPEEEKKIDDGYIDPFAVIIDPYTCRDVDQDPAKYAIHVEEFQKRWALLQTSTFMKRF